ncbi:MAG TPA: MFS transporter [Candidatus Bathyarchaeia archaeon]|nr:MFS transporter [Candidatus Bathyarchaeia archaeon]
METTVERETLWQNSDFLKLWTSETISQFGSQFTGLALPLTAIIILGAKSVEVGVLNFAGSVPWLLFGLIAGVWIDRHRKQRIMVTSNILRGTILALIPVTAALGIITKLGLPFLYAISFCVGFLQVFFDITYQSYLPSLVRRDQLVEGNRNLQASASTAQVAGPTIAGIVISIITAPIAIAVDAASFFASALSLGRIGHEEVIDTEIVRPSVLADIREGLHVVFGNRMLRMIAGCTGTSNFFGTALGTLFLLYLIEPSPAGLGVSENLAGVTAGIIFSVASVGALVGVAVSTRVAKSIGVGPAILVSILIAGLGAIPYYLSGSLTASPLLTIGGFGVNWSMLAIMGGQFVSFIGTIVYNVNQVSLRQAIVPLRLQGRMNATMRFLVWGTIPLGAIAGGLLGEFLGLRTAIGIAILGGSLAFLWVLFSPVRSLKTIPQHTE